MAGEERSVDDVNKAPGQIAQGVTTRKAKELAQFFQRRGINHMNMQNMHPAVLEHHWRAAGLKGAPSEETLKELAKHMAPGRM